MEMAAEGFKAVIGSHQITRRALLASASAALAGKFLRSGRSFAAPATDAPAFAHRGYYITFMRMPTFGLEAWKSAIDCFAADGINLLMLWMAGGFASKKFPITWKYNAE